MGVCSLHQVAVPFLSGDRQTYTGEGKGGSWYSLISENIRGKLHEGDEHIPQQKRDAENHQSDLSIVKEQRICGHTPLNTPDPIWSLKLSRVWPG